MKWWINITSYVIALPLPVLIKFLAIDDWFDHFDLNLGCAQCILQVFAASIAKGPGNVSLNASYKHADGYAFQVLGLTISSFFCYPEHDKHTFIVSPP